MIGFLLAAAKSVPARVPVVDMTPLFSGVANGIKPLIPLLVVVFALKLLITFIPSRKSRNRHHVSRTATPRGPMSACPECNGMVSVKAKACPHCGAPVSAAYARDYKEKCQRKRREGRSAKVFQLLATGVAIGGVSIAVLHGKLMWLGLLVAAIFIMISFVHSKNGKGFVGEKVVAMVLKKDLEGRDCFVLNDIYLPLKDGSTTQVDHVVVSRFGVFVIETKNYGGWIFASKDSAVWTQTIFKEKNVFQNPLRQNYSHICAIVDNLGLPREVIRGVVVFLGECEFKTPMPEGVVYCGDLVSYIKSFRAEIIPAEDIVKIVGALYLWNESVTPEQRRAHVANLKARHQA